MAKILRTEKDETNHVLAIRGSVPVLFRQAVSLIKC